MHCPVLSISCMAQETATWHTFLSTAEGGSILKSSNVPIKRQNTVWMHNKPCFKTFIQRCHEAGTAFIMLVRPSRCMNCNLVTSVWEKNTKMVWQVKAFTLQLNDSLYSPIFFVCLLIGTGQATQVVYHSLFTSNCWEQIMKSWELIWKLRAAEQ